MGTRVFRAYKLTKQASLVELINEFKIFRETLLGEIAKPYLRDMNGFYEIQKLVWKKVLENHFEIKVALYVGPDGTQYLQFFFTDVHPAAREANDLNALIMPGLERLQAKEFDLYDDVPQYKKRQKEWDSVFDFLGSDTPNHAAFMYTITSDTLVLLYLTQERQKLRDSGKL